MGHLSRNRFHLLAGAPRLVTGLLRGTLSRTCGPVHAPEPVFPQNCHIMTKSKATENRQFTTNCALRLDCIWSLVAGSLYLINPLRSEEHTSELQSLRH